jgi:protoporphyrinogen oxidase
VFGDVSGTAEVVKIYRHPEGHTQFWPGYIGHLRRFEADALHRRIALAGDYLVAPTVEGAVLSGERAAERVLRLPDRG